MLRYSSAISIGKDSYRSAVDTESDPVKLAEALLEAMHIDHWRTLSTNAQCNASTMHGILRAPRGDGKEAIVLVTPVHGMYQALQCCPYLVTVLVQQHMMCRQQICSVRGLCSHTSGCLCPAVSATCSLVSKGYCVGGC